MARRRRRRQPCLAWVYIGNCIWECRLTQSTRHCCLPLLAAAAALTGTPSPVEASVPLPRPPARLSLGAPPSALLADDESVVVAAPGSLYGVELNADGTPREAWRSPLPETVQPSALGGGFEQHGEGPLEVLDRAGEQVLLLQGNEKRGFRQLGGLPAGREPSDLALTDLNGDGHLDMVIADAGADALTVWMGRRGNAWGPMRTFPVGHRPVALATGSFDGRRTSDLAVADSGSNAVTILYGDGKGGIRRRQNVPVGAAPTALAAFGDSESLTDTSLNSDSIDDLAIVDGGANEVRVLLGDSDGPYSYSVTHFPPGSRPIAIAPGRFARSGHMDAAVTLGGSAAMSFLLGDGHGHLSAEAPVIVGGQPTALTTGDYAGDALSDVVLADATGAVESIIPGDRLLVATSSAQQISAAAGVLYWSQEIGSRWRERSWRSDGTTTLAIPPSTRSVFLYPGLDPRGRHEVTYVRCLHRRCAAHAFRLPRGPESSVPIHAPGGCEIGQFARWRHLSAYVIGPQRRRGCPAADRGLWIDPPRRPPRRVAKKFVNLTGVHGTTIAWSDGYLVKDGPGVVRMRVATSSGSPHTLDVGYAGGDACDEGFSLAGVFERGYLYWSGECDSSISAGHVSFKRARLQATDCRSSLGAIVEFPPFDFAVDNGRIFYAADRGLVEVDPSRQRWPRERCRR
jgi:hypothetical protein